MYFIVPIYYLISDWQATLLQRRNVPNNEAQEETKEVPERVHDDADSIAGAGVQEGPLRDHGAARARGPGPRPARASRQDLVPEPPDEREKRHDQRRRGRARRYER